MLAAFMFSNVMYAALVMVLPLSQTAGAGGLAESAHSLCYTVAAAGLLASLYWTVARMTAAPSSQQLLIDMIVAAAFAEVSAISGLVLVLIAHKRAEFWPFAIAALLVEGLFILPRALMRD